MQTPPNTNPSLATSLGLSLGCVVLCVAVSVGMGVGIAEAGGGGRSTLRAIAGVVTVAGLVGLVPLLLRVKQPMGGMVVLGVTLMQTVVAMAGALGLGMLEQFERRPLVLASFAGVFLLTILQTLVSLRACGAMGGTTNIHGVKHDSSRGIA